MNIHLCGSMRNKVLLLACLMAFRFLPLSASHNIGLEMTLECLSSCQMKVNIKAYRDCQGAPQSKNEPLWIPRDTLCTTLPYLIAQSTMTSIEITPVCPLAVTSCANAQSTIGGVQEYRWYYVYEICQASSCVFDLQYRDCCRNQYPTTISWPNGHSLTILHEEIDLGAPGCNSSPVYPNIPLIYTCASQPRTYYMGGSDPDGDSLAYSLATCWSQPGDTVDYLAGYDYLNPMGPDWECWIDSSGVLHLDPQPGPPMVAVVCVRTDEYRNGILVGSNYRDMQVIVMPCNANQTPSIGSVQIVSGTATAVGLDVYACPQSALCFDVYADDADSGQALHLQWDQSIAGATFADTLNPLLQDTVWSYQGGPAVGRFCWTPPGPGTYGFSVTAEDDFCPVSAGASAVIRIHVGSPPQAMATAVVNGCLNYDFSAVVGGCPTSGNFTYQWTGADNISSSSATFTHHYSYPGLFPWQLVVSDGQGFQDTIRDTILVQQSITTGQLISGGTPLDACQGPFSTVLTAASGYLNYHWSTGSTSTTTLVSSGGTVAVTVEEPTTGCLVTDVTTISMNPAPISGTVYSSLGSPLPLQEVLLLRLRSNPVGLEVIDSTTTDAGGYYQFCNVVDTGLAVRVEPDALTYPNEMPTYCDSALVWNQSRRSSPTLQGPATMDIHCQFGQNPGGSAGLGGIVLEGPLAGPPVEALRVFIRDQASGQLRGHRSTNSAGYFEFLGLPLGTYEVVPDFPFVDENLPPVVLLAQGAPVRTNLDFRLHPTWLELLNPVAVDGYINGIGKVGLSPNPFADLADIRLELLAPAVVRIEAIDLLGRSHGVVASGKLARGTHHWPIGDGLPRGVHFLVVTVGASTATIRFVKL